MPASYAVRLGKRGSGPAALDSPGGSGESLARGVPHQREEEDMTDGIEVVGIVGSLRPQSFSRRLALALASVVRGAP